MQANPLLQPKIKLYDHPKYQPIGRPVTNKPAPFLPINRQEMEKLGWDSCDIIIVTGDAYVDHPSFGMAVIGRMLEAQGFRVGILSQPQWTSKEPFMALGKPNLFFGVTAGNMDSMINRYTADRKLRFDDAYTAGNIGGKRPDRAVTVYTQRCKEAFKEVPVIIGGIEASLRRIAHYDYWSDIVKRSVIFDAKADILVYGNAERPLVEIAHRIAQGESCKALVDICGTAVIQKHALPGWRGVDSRDLDKLGKIDAIPNPYLTEGSQCPDKNPDPTNPMPLNPAQSTSPQSATAQPITVQPFTGTPITGTPITVQPVVAQAVAAQAITVQPITVKPAKLKPWEKVYVNLPTYDQVKSNKLLYAHASRILHQETNPGCARALAQSHGDRILWVNPPALPLETDEMDSVFDLPYARVPHPIYGKEKIPAYDMIRFSVNIMRGCFGGCSFCSITEHEGRIIQSRSEQSIVKEIEQIRDKVPGFTGVISDLGGPTANMYKLRCKNDKAESTCRRLSCVYPTICGHMDTDHQPTIDLYRQARNIKGVKKILVASGVRYDLAVEDPRYVKELALHHVGGYLKIAPEHTEDGPLSKMMKPGMGSYHKFKELFDRYSKEAGKEQYLIPYFISAHPGTTDMDMVNLALWLKQNKFKLDQVQNFYPSPMANATTIYHTEVDSLHKVSKKSERVSVPKGIIQRRLHKAILRYHDPKNWSLIRDALTTMGLSELIGRSPHHLVPPESRDEQSKRGNSYTPRGQRAATKFTKAQFKPMKQTPASKSKAVASSAETAGATAGAKTHGGGKNGGRSKNDSGGKNGGHGKRSAKDSSKNEETNTRRKAANQYN